MEIAPSEPTTPIAVIGGGPAGLMAADVISQAGQRVDVFESRPSCGRKFLVAGKGGLNLTHAEPLEKLLLRFTSAAGFLAPLIRRFGPDEVRDWAKQLGVDTFVGSSGRVFPKDMMALPLLTAWRSRLSAAGVQFHTQHRWVGWNDDVLQFETPAGQKSVDARATVLALGGGSWRKLGSDGEWMPVLAGHGVDTVPLKPSNCGFELEWSEYLRSRHAGTPLKSVVLRCVRSDGTTFERKGDLVLTDYGLEGGLVYAASAFLRDEIAANGNVSISLDLLPDRTSEDVLQKVRGRGSSSVPTLLKKRFRLKSVHVALLRETLPAGFGSEEELAGTLKHVPLQLTRTRPIDEAISTAGGVAVSAVDERLMLRSRPGVFCAGEMLDWEAPTGGYLLTACFSTGHRAGAGVLEWLRQSHAE